MSQESSFDIFDLYLQQGNKLSSEAKVDLGRMVQQILRDVIQQSFNARNERTDNNKEEMITEKDVETVIKRLRSPPDLLVKPSDELARMMVAVKRFRAEKLAQQNSK